MLNAIQVIACSDRQGLTYHVMTAIALVDFSSYLEAREKRLLPPVRLAPLCLFIVHYVQWPTKFLMPLSVFAFIEPRDGIGLLSSGEV